MEEDSYTRVEIEEFLKKVKTHQTSSLFLQPIEEVIESFPLYSEVVKHPIDLTKILTKNERREYHSREEIKNDLDLMIANCKTFNSLKKSWAYKSAEQLETLINREWKKMQLKIEKHLINKQNIIAQSQMLNANQNLDSNIQVVSSSEDEKITKKIKNLFQKLAGNLNISEQQREEIIAVIVKSIVKRSKSFEQIYEDTMKFLEKHLNNTNNIKSYFSKKFRKLLRSIKEEQTEGLKQMDKTFNIKINLNENDEKREEKEKLDIVRKEVINFIDNQKVPEVFRNVMEYPIEPNLRKKITSHVNDIRNMFITTFK